MFPAGGRNKDNFVCMRHHAWSSSANRFWEANRQDESYQSIDSKSMCSVETMKSYTLMMQGSYREIISHLPV